MKYINKKISFILFLGILINIFVSFSSCNINIEKSLKATSEILSTVALDDSKNEIQDFDVPDWFSNYTTIIDEYKKFVDYIISGRDSDNTLDSIYDNNIFNSPDNELSYHWDCMIRENYTGVRLGYIETKNDFGYAFKDLNGDGNDELILLLQDYTILAIFSMSNDKPKLIDAFWARHICAIYNSELLYTLSSGGSVEWYYEVQRISPTGNGLIQVEKYGMTNEGEHSNYYKVMEGETYIISEADFNEFQKRFPALSDITADEITKNSEIEYIPLFK